MASEEEIASLKVKLGIEVDKKEGEEASELLDKLKEGLEYFAGFEAVKGLFELVEHQTEAAVSAKHLAEQLGVSIESVQELGYAADVTGGSTDGMRIALQHLALAMQTTSKTGTGPLADGLVKLHIPLANLKKEKLDQNLEEIAEGFKNAGPEVNKTAVAMEIFGRQGAKLIPLLNKGKDGIKELRAEFVEIGNETSDEQAEKLEKLEEAQKKVKYLWEGIKFDAVMAILPTLQKLVETFFNWVKANRELIASSLVNMMMALAKAFEIAGTAAGIFVRFFDFISQDGDAVTAILVGIGAAIAYVAGSALLAWAAGNLMMIGWAGAIAGIIYGIMKLIDLFEYLWDEAEEGSGWAIAGIVGLTTALGVLAIGAAFALKDVLIDGIVTALANMVGLVGIIWEAVIATAAWTAELLLNPMTWIVLAIVAAVALLVGGIYELYKHWTAVTDAITGFGKKIEDFFSSLADAVSRAWDQMIDYLSNKWDEFEKDHPWIAKGIHVGVSVGRGIKNLVSGGGAVMDAADQMHAANSGAGAGDTHNEVNTEIHVHAGPGMDEDKLAEATKDQFNEMWEQKVRTNYAGTGVG